MTRPLVLVALAAGALATAAAAQAQTPVSDALRSTEKKHAKNLVAAAEEMPADKYGYAPTKAQMTFGKVIAHLGMGNDLLCSKLSGVDAPKRPALAEGASKEQLVTRLRESFQFCDSALAKVNDSDLSAKLSLFGPNQFTRAETMFITAEDWADHYSQISNYLRLNGLLPPTAKGKQSE